MRSLVPSRHDTRASNFDVTSHRLLLGSRHQRDNGSPDGLDGHRNGAASGGVRFRTNAGSLRTTRRGSLTVVAKHGARQSFAAWAQSPAWPPDTEQASRQVRGFDGGPNRRSPNVNIQRGLLTAVGAAKRTVRFKAKVGNHSQSNVRSVEPEGDSMATQPGGAPARSGAPSGDEKSVGA